MNKLAIIGGSGLYDVEEFKDRELISLNTPWGKPSDQILKTKFNDKEIYFLPRHGKGHFISPTKINFRAKHTVTVRTSSSRPNVCTPTTLARGD